MFSVDTRGVPPLAILPVTTDTSLVARRPATSLAALSSRFARDERGTVAMIFGLMVIPCVMLVGFAVDVGRMIAVKAQVQGVIDNASLAGGRAAQTSVSANMTDVDTAAQTAANAYWNAHKNKLGHVIASATSVVYAPNAARSELTWTVTTWVPTPFMTSASMFMANAAQSGAPSGCEASGWQCQKLVISGTSMLQAGGLNKETNVEISMMLDVTGSMNGQKLTDLKVAAKDLVDIVVWNDQSKVTSRVALAPFADGINVGTTMAPQVRGTVAAGTNPVKDVIGTGFQNFWFKKKEGGDRTYKLSNSCVTERTGFDKYTDAAPSVSPVGRSYAESDGSCSLVNTGDTEVNLVTPLSSDKVMLKRRIDKLVTAGSTAGQLGTAWAWYLLSPSWSYLYPTASAPQAYNDPKVRKIAILMTDGEYNTQFWKGVKDKDAYDGRSDWYAENGSSEDQAQALCTAIKAKNIEVFTVGFQAPQQAKNFLAACATDAAHYYDASTGDALRYAFREIALKVSTLRISK
jgi:Flp pilus assembly protein TadG